VAQSAWIQNATLRDNILFGDPFNSAKYDNALTVCALKPDLDILSDGDQTEIGEKVCDCDLKSTKTACNILKFKNVTFTYERMICRV